MFKIFRLVYPLISSKIVYLLIIIFSSLSLVGLGFNYVDNKIQKLNEANAKIEKNEIVITELNKTIANIQDELIKIKESNDLTLVVLKTIQEQKNIIVKKTVQKEKVIDEKITLINNDNIVNDSIKDIERSKLYVEDLFNTVCELDKTHCNKEINK